MSGEIPADGTHVDVDMAEYLRWPVWSASMLTVWRSRTPAFALWALHNNRDLSDSAATSLGTLTHSAILEPDTLETLFVPEPEPDPTTYLTDAGKPGKNVRALKSFKLAVEELAARNPAATIVTAEQWRQALAMRDAVQAHAGARGLIEAAGVIEASILATDAETGVRMKIRPDKLVTIPTLTADVNVKTTQNAHRDPFSVDLFRFRYFVGFAFYRRALIAAGYDEPASIALAIDTEGPPLDRVAVHELDPGAIDAGEQLVDKYLQEIAVCTERDKWPGHPADIRSISLPPWAWRRVDDELTEERGLLL